MQHHRSAFYYFGFRDGLTGGKMPERMIEFLTPQDNVEYGLGFKDARDTSPKGWQEVEAGKPA